MILKNYKNLIKQMGGGAPDLSGSTTKKHFF